VLEAIVDDATCGTNFRICGDPGAAAACAALAADATLALTAAAVRARRAGALLLCTTVWVAPLVTGLWCTVRLGLRTVRFGLRAMRPLLRGRAMLLRGRAMLLRVTAITEVAVCKARWALADASFAALARPALAVAWCV
jgi:hypothetical protein